MSLAEIEKQVLELPVEERRTFVNWVHDHYHELMGGNSEQVWDDLSPEQLAELDLRVKEMDEHPEQMIPWEEVRAELHQFSYELRHSLYPESQEGHQGSDRVVRAATRGA